MPLWVMGEYWLARPSMSRRGEHMGPRDGPIPQPLSLGWPEGFQLSPSSYIQASSR